MRVRLSRLANEELIEVSRYLDALHPTAADRFMDTVTAALDRLGTFPLSGTARPDLSQDVRMVSLDKHVILYRALSTEVLVVRIAHGRRNLKALLDEQ
jgi:toxin ParE1/3/4